MTTSGLVPRDLAISSLATNAVTTRTLTTAVADVQQLFVDGFPVTGGDLVLGGGESVVGTLPVVGDTTTTLLTPSQIVVTPDGKSLSVPGTVNAAAFDADEISVVSASIDGAVTAGSASVSGAVTAGSASVAGAVTAGTVSVSGQVMASTLSVQNGAEFKQSVVVSTTLGALGNFYCNNGSLLNGTITLGGPTTSQNKLIVRGDGAQFGVNSDAAFLKVYDLQMQTGFAPGVSTAFEFAIQRFGAMVIVAWKTLDLSSQDGRTNVLFIRMNNQIQQRWNNLVPASGYAKTPVSIVNNGITTTGLCVIDRTTEYPDNLVFKFYPSPDDTAPSPVWQGPVASVAASSITYLARDV